VGNEPRGRGGFEARRSPGREREGGGGQLYPVSTACRLCVYLSIIAARYVDQYPSSDLVHRVGLKGRPQYQKCTEKLSTAAAVRCLAVGEGAKTHQAAKI